MLDNGPNHLSDEDDGDCPPPPGRGRPGAHGDTTEGEPKR